MHRPTTRRAATLGALFTLLLGLNVGDVLAQGAATKSAVSERKAAPTGADIAAAARGAALDAANTGNATLFGKPFKFTPAKADKDDPIEAGAFVGVLENGAAGDETGLPAGKYNIFVAKVNGQWKGYAETGGQIVREAIRVRTTAAGGSAKAGFEEKGWCVRFLYYPYRIYVCY